MRRFPSSWDKTLAALGFRRNVKRVKREYHRPNGIRIESLERREMLSVSPNEGDYEAVPRTELSDDTLVESIRPEYVLADSAAGDTPEQFEITTEYSKSGQPTAVIKLKEGFERIDRSLQELTVELRLGKSVLARHEVLIDIAESRFVHEFQAARIAALPAPLETEATDVREWVTRFDTEGRFDDLGGGQSGLTPELEKVFDSQYVIQGGVQSRLEPGHVSSLVTPQQSAESLERLAKIAKQQAADPTLLASKTDRASFYKGLERTLAETPTPQRDKASDQGDAKRLDELALTLGKQIQRDLSSDDNTVVEAAQKARAELLGKADSYYTMLNGFDKNHELESRAGFDGRTEFAINIVEEGTLQIDDTIRVELGNFDAMVQTETSWLAGASQAFRSAALSVDFGPFRDATVRRDDPTANDNTDRLGVETIHGAFVEAGGQVSIEAENFHANVAGTNDDWVTRTDKPGYSGDGFVRAELDADGTPDYDDSPSYLSGSPRLDYEVEFSQAGTYYVWVRGLYTGGQDDSLHIGINNQANTTADRIVLGGSPNSFNWSRSRISSGYAQITIPSAGTHTINLWMREDGARVDKLVLTTDSLYTPTLDGPAESTASTPIPTTASLLGFDLSAYAGSAPTYATLKLTPAAADGAAVSLAASNELWGSGHAATWDESSVDWNDYEADLLPEFGSTIAQATPQVGSTTSFNVTETLQRSLLLGDSNLNSEVDRAGAAGDIEAFYLAATDFTAYTTKYVGLEHIEISNGYVYRNDANVDGVVDATDATPYFERMGVPRGDFNLDGEVDGKDYSVWADNFGASAERFGQGDANLNSVVDTADYTVWNDSFGATTTAPTSPDVTFRLLADEIGQVEFYSSESAVSPPELTVQFASRVVVQSFGSVNGELRVNYEVQHENATEPNLRLYQVVDGVRTLLKSNYLLGKTVGLHEATFSNDFTIADPDQPYTLVAEIFSEESTPTWREFDGGVFETSDGKVHAHGTAGDDTVVFEDGRLTVSDAGGEIDAFTAGSIDFDDVTLVEYGAQTTPVGGNTPLYEARDDGQTLYLENNVWKAIALPYTVTSNTVVEFDYESSAVGELHGFGFDDDLGLSGDRLFRLHGTQNISSDWKSTGESDYQLSDGLRHYRIRVGDEFTGSSNHLFFVADSDATGLGNSAFSNFRVYEDVAGSQPEVYVHAHGGDDTLAVENHGGASVTLVGGRGDDLYALTGNVQATSTVRVSDERGFDEIKLISPDATTAIDLDSTATQMLFAPAGVQATVGLQQSGVEVASGLSTSRISGPGYSYDLEVTDPGDNEDDRYLTVNPIEGGVGLSLREAIKWAGEIPGKQTIGFSEELFLAGPRELIIDSQPDPGLPARNLVILNDLSIMGPGANLLTIKGKLSPEQPDYYDLDDPKREVFSAFAIEGSQGQHLDVSIAGISITDTAAWGIKSEYADLTLSGVDIYDTGNNAPYYVGAQRAGVSSVIGTLEIDNSSVRDSAYYGIYAEVSSLRLTNTSVFGNGYRGVHFYGGQSTYITNSTIVDNSNTGLLVSGVTDDDGEVTVSINNSIILGRPSSGAAALLFDQEPTPTGDNNLLGSLSTALGANYTQLGSSGNSETIETIGLVLTAPGDGPTPGYRIDPNAYAPIGSSPAIDAGSDAVAPSVDQWGNFRHDNAGVVAGVSDIGAIEYVPEDLLDAAAGNPIALGDITDDLLALVGVAASDEFRVTIYSSDPLAGTFSGATTGSAISASGNRAALQSALNSTTFTPHPVYGGEISLLLDVEALSGIDSGTRRTVVLEDRFVYPTVFVVNSLSDGHDASASFDLSEDDRVADSIADTGGNPHSRETTLRAAIEEIHTLGPILEDEGVTDWSPVIKFSENLGSDLRIDLDPTLGSLDISRAGLTIAGPTGGALTIDANGSEESQSRVFYVEPGASLTLRDLTVTGGYLRFDSQAGGAGDGGGGILNDGELTLERVTVEGNAVFAADSNYNAGWGGGLFNRSSSSALTILDSQILNNRGLYGGGLASRAYLGQSLTIDRSTIAYNRAEGGGGQANGGGLNILGVSDGASHTDATIRITNTTLSSNIAERSGGAYVARARDVEFTHVTVADNHSEGLAGGLQLAFPGATATTSVVADAVLVAQNTSTAGDDNASVVGASVFTTTESIYGPGSVGVPSETSNAAAGLSALADHGGTLTHAITTESPAWNAASTTSTADQRGVDRDGSPDAGAFEYVMTAETPANGVLLGDFDGDGRDGDRLTHSPSDGVIYVTLDRDGAGPEPWATGLTGIFKAPRVGDFNGDGRDDLTYEANLGVRQLLLSESTRFVTHSVATNGWFTDAVLVGDFDADGSDELIGRKYGDNATNDSNWELIDYTPSGGAVLTDTGVETHSGGWNFGKGLIAADANRDGRDDIIGRGASAWFVALSADDGGSVTFNLDNPTNGGGGVDLFGSNWGNWFDGHMSLDADGRLTGDADGPIKFVAEKFAEVYNNVELELYHGIRKGPQATQGTGAGSPYDQAALLTQLLSGVLDYEGNINNASYLRYEPTLVTGEVTATVKDVADWIGAKLVDGAYPAVPELLKILDPNFVPAGQVNPNHTVTFRHAWVRLRLPRFDSQASGNNPSFNGATFDQTQIAIDGNPALTDRVANYIDIDPSWNIGNWHSSVDLPTADLFPTDGFSYGLFDEIKYLDSSARVSGGSIVDVRPDTPLEFFEEEVQQWLTQKHQGLSLTDVFFRNSTQVLSDHLPTEWGGGSVTSANSIQQGPYNLAELESAGLVTNGFDIIGNASKEEQLTYRIHITSTSDATSHLNYSAVASEIALSDVRLTMEKSGVLATPLLYIDDALVSPPRIGSPPTIDPAYSLSLGSDLAFSLKVVEAGHPLTSTGAEEFNLTFSLAADESGSSHAIGIGLGQHSDITLQRASASLLEAVTTTTDGTPSDTEPASAFDIDKTLAAVAIGLAAQARVSTGHATRLTHTVGVPATTVAVASSAHEITDFGEGVDVAAATLPYAILPSDLTADLVRGKQLFLRRSDGLLSKEVSQLVGWNDAGLLSETLAKWFAADTASALDLLKRAYAGEDLLQGRLIGAVVELEQTTRDSYVVEITAKLDAQGHLLISYPSFHSHDLSQASVHFDRWTTPAEAAGQSLSGYEYDIFRSTDPVGGLTASQSTTLKENIVKLFSGDFVFNENTRGVLSGGGDNPGNSSNVVGPNSVVGAEIGAVIAESLSHTPADGGQFTDVRFLAQTTALKKGSWEGASFILEREGGAVFSYTDRFDADEQFSSTTIESKLSIGDGNIVGVSTVTFSPSELTPTVISSIASVGGSSGSLVRGSVALAIRDITLPGPTEFLVLNRRYDSSQHRDIGLGVGWTHSFSDRLLRNAVDDGSGNLTVTDDLVWYTSDGVEHLFEWDDDDDEYISPSQLLGNLTGSPSGGTWTYIDRDGMKVRFEKPPTPFADGVGEKDRSPLGRLKSKLDLNSNGVIVTYASGGSDDLINYVRDAHYPEIQNQAARRLDFTYGTGATHIQYIDKWTEEDTNSRVARWTYGYLGSFADSQQRLTSVSKPSTTQAGATVDAPAAAATADAYVYYGQESGDAAVFNGLLKRAIAPNSNTIEYQYYPNERVFKVTTEGESGVEHSETYTYDLVNGKTITRDANGAEATYFYNEDGLITRVINPDRTRTETEWGLPLAEYTGGLDEDFDGIADGTEFLRRTTTDEVGAVEQFTYHASGFDDRELETSRSKRYEDAAGNIVTGTQDGVLTKYDYIKRGETVRISMVTVDPNGGLERSTNFVYDGVGRLIETSDAEGNLTQHSYYVEPDTPSTDSHHGLLQSITSPRGKSRNDIENEAVAWRVLSDDFSVDSGTLTVTLSPDDLTPGGIEYTVTDAVRIERIGPDGSVQTIRIQDDDISSFSAPADGGSGFWFNEPSGPDGLINNGSSNLPKMYLGDAVSISPLIFPRGDYGMALD